MWILPVNRSELVDLLSPHAGGQRVTAIEELRPSFEIARHDRMVAIWPADPNEFGRMPTMIVTGEGELRNVLAWLATYVRDFRPFTAFCRVVERAVAEKFLKSSATPTLNRVEGLCAGLILGESLMHARGRSAIFDLPFSAYSATLSHAISRAYALTNGDVSIDDMAQLWSQARDVTGQATLVPPIAILSVWSIALGMPRRIGHHKSLFDATEILVNSWFEINSSGELSDVLWRELMHGYNGLDSMRLITSLPREQRVHMIDIALHTLVSAKGDEERRSFLAGYFTSLLGPGTLDHAEFLTPISTELPMSYLWYGLFAGATPRVDSLPVGNPLARRIIRDLTLPDRVIDRPRCDVAIEELTMYGSPENLMKMTSKAGRLDIDILPGVTTSVRWPPHNVPNELESKRDRDIEARRLLAELDEHTSRSRHLTERLSDLMLLGEIKREPPFKKKRGSKS